MGVDVHARGVHPDEERLAGLHRFLDELLGTRGGFDVDGFHALGGQGPGVLDLAVGEGMQHAARAEVLHVRIVGVLGPVRPLRFFLGIEVVQVAEKFVEAVLGRQVFILVAEVVLAELPRSVALFF